MSEFHRLKKDEGFGQLSRQRFNNMSMTSQSNPGSTKHLQSKQKLNFQVSTSNFGLERIDSENEN